MRPPHGPGWLPRIHICYKAHTAPVVALHLLRKVCVASEGGPLDGLPDLAFERRKGLFIRRKKRLHLVNNGIARLCITRGVYAVWTSSAPSKSFTLV